MAHRACVQVPVDLQPTCRTMRAFVDEVRIEGTMESRLCGGAGPEPPTCALAEVALLRLRAPRRTGTGTAGH